MALIYPKIPNVIVNTGGNYPHVWETIRQLKVKRIKVIVLGSPNKGFSTYYDYIAGENLKPFYKSCSDKAKQQHLHNFAKIVGPLQYNIGFVKGEEDRVIEFENTKWAPYGFPMLSFTREQCKKILRAHGVEARKTGCWFCGKQPKSSWLELREEYPHLWQEAVERDWLPDSLSEFRIIDEDD